MQIFIRTAIGPVFAIVCEPEDTILMVKQQMEKKYEEGMPPDQQRLIYGGKNLEDNRTLAEYSIIHNTTIHICLRLRGGN